MNIKLNTTIIRDISKDFSCGNSLWAIARLNEYGKSDSLLRKAILKKYEFEINSISIDQEILNKLLNGEKLSSLSLKEIREIKSLSKNRKSERKTILKSRSFRNRKHSFKELRVA